MQMKLKWGAAAATALVAGLACAQDVQVVRIGHVAPTSGAQAHYGKDNENGVRMAIEDLNAQNIVINNKRIRFEIVAEDDAADPKQGTAAAQKLCDSKVSGVVGHLNSGTTIPASKVYNDCGIPHITGAATNPNLTRPGYKTTFRIIANDNALGAGLAVHAADVLKIKRVASSMTAPPTARAWPRCSSAPRCPRASRWLTSSSPPTRPPTSWPS